MKKRCTRNWGFYFQFSQPATVLVNYRYSPSALIAMMEGEIMWDSLKMSVKDFSFPDNLNQKDETRTLNLYLLEVLSPQHYKIGASQLENYLAQLNFRFATSYEMLFAIRNNTCQKYLRKNDQTIDVITMLGDYRRAKTIPELSLGGGGGPYFRNYRPTEDIKKCLEPLNNHRFLIAQEINLQASTRDSIENGKKRLIWP